MPVRNQILDLHRSNKLNYGAVPLSTEDQQLLIDHIPGVLDRMANPDIFEFKWEDAGIWLDNDLLVHYPDIDDQEWEEAVKCPVPHPVIWVETNVRDPQNQDDRTYIWHIEREGLCGYKATPLIFYRDTLFYSGIFFELDPEAVDNFGVRGSVTISYLLESYARDYDLEEYFRQADTLARLFRILSLPKVQVTIWEPPAKLNKARRKRGREPLATRKIVSIDTADLEVARSGPNGTTHALPTEHFRRAHQRHLRNGRVVSVRECIVNKGTSETGAVPQDFRVS